MSKDWSYGESNKNIVLSETPKQKLRITGHRISSVLGLNEYQTEFGAWCEITKLAKKPFEETKYTKFGKEVEEKLIKIVNEKFPNVISITDYYGVNIERYKWNNFIDDSNIFGGIMDAVGTKNDMKTLSLIVECKSSSKPHLWENGNVPVDYLLQGCLYAYLKGLDRVLFICCFPQDLDYNHPELFQPNETNTVMTLKKIKNVMIELKNGELITFEQAIEYCEEWWKKYIETGISPEFDETKDKEYLDIIRTSNPINDNSLDELCDIAKELLEEIDVLKINSDLYEKEKELENIEDSIKKILMDNLEPGSTKISHKQYKLSGSVSQEFNKKLFKEKNPKVYEQYVEDKITYRLSKHKQEEVRNETNN